MKAEDVAANLEQVASQWDAADPSRGGSHERKQAAAIRELIEERDRLRAALQGLLRHPGIADMDPEDKDPEDHALESAARAALEPRK